MFKNKQDAFDFVVKFARKQGEKCAISQLESKDMYKYRHPTKPLKCLVGSAISDDDYNILMENISAVSVISNYDPDSLKINSCSLNETKIFWEEMQNIHDNYRALDWENQFKIFARFNELTCSAP